MTKNFDGRGSGWGILAVVVALVFSPAFSGDAPQPMPDFLNETEPRARLLILGTFHFDDVGLDSHKPEHRFNALSKRRQGEIDAVLDLLEGFRPTKIAVEVRENRQEELDESYRQFNAGDLEPRPDETYQIGFRLGRRLKLDRLHAVDAQGRSYFPEMTDEQWEARMVSLLEGVDPERIAAESAWDERYESIYAWEDALINKQTLREHLVFINDEETLRRHHGHYLVGSFKLGRDEDYFGADVKTRWYNRNLRIFQNVLRLVDGPQDRILLLIGNGHVPILRHAALASPDLDLIDVEEVLRASTAERKTAP